MGKIVTVTLEDIYDNYSKNLYDITADNEWRAISKPDGYDSDKEMTDMFELLKVIAAAQEWEEERQILRKAFNDGYAWLLIPRDLIDPRIDDEEIEELRIVKWARPGAPHMQQNEILIMVLTGSEICM
jgi:hypothetical protein